eukprot:2423075-Rhodomonas_salina.1
MHRGTCVLLIQSCHVARTAPRTLAAVPHPWYQSPPLLVPLRVCRYQYRAIPRPECHTPELETLPLTSKTEPMSQLINNEEEEQIL